MPRPKKQNYIDKEKWNELLPVGNGECPIHGFRYWYGTSNLKPNMLNASNCPECEFNEFKTYSEMTKELYKDVRNQEKSKGERDNDQE